MALGYDGDWNCLLRKNISDMSQQCCFLLRRTARVVDWSASAHSSEVRGTRLSGGACGLGQIKHDVTGRIWAWQKMRSEDQQWKSVNFAVEHCRKQRSLVNQPVFSGLRMRARKGEGEGKEKRSGQTRQVFEIAWNVWRNCAHLGARRAPIVQTAQAQGALLSTVQL